MGRPWGRWMWKVMVVAVVFTIGKIIYSFNPVYKDTLLNNIKAVNWDDKTIFGHNNGTSIKMDFRAEQVDVSLQQLNEEITSLGHIDSRGMFKTHQFQLMGREWQNVSRNWQVCLCTQTSVDKMFWIVPQTESWAGPFSVAILVPSYDYSVVVAMIAFLQRCKEELLQRVAFHISYPITLPPQLDKNTWRLAANFSCDMNPKVVNKKLVEILRPASLSTYLKKALYPQNLLRNVARNACNTRFTFVLDVDMILVNNIDTHLNNFFARNSSRECSKCAYIVPTYEIHTTVSHNPENKQQLLHLLNKKLARRFHERSFYPNQGNSELSKWEKLNLTSEFGVGYIIPDYVMQWEPIYIAQGDIPMFDERFIGFGYDRSSQFLEMAMAGFSWHMLNNAFTCHRGFQEKTKDPIRNHQIMQNKDSFQTLNPRTMGTFNRDEENRGRDNEGLEIEENGMKIRDETASVTTQSKEDIYTIAYKTPTTKLVDAAISRLNHLGWDTGDPTGLEGTNIDCCAIKQSRNKHQDSFTPWPISKCIALTPFLRLQKSALLRSGLLCF
ncbi:hypothetical protein Pcinc_005670 [Petrolisthes cinctipes]|uniref:Beta-1,4-glucuronyltransferase 1 n=1 Tax=Petrolisthes cinctipes TaxID=88211 RepID=A0AAE1GEG9_PETCI|nr:hypothetical protein Pcinc_005670 [Petrolisthes cinctipes]